MKRLILAVALAQMLGCEMRPECNELPRPARCTCYADANDRATDWRSRSALGASALSCFEAYRAESGVIR